VGLVPGSEARRVAIAAATVVGMLALTVLLVRFVVPKVFTDKPSPAVETGGPTPLISLSPDVGPGRYAAPEDICPRVDTTVLVAAFGPVTDALKAEQGKSELLVGLESDTAVERRCAIPFGPQPDGSALTVNVNATYLEDTKHGVRVYQAALESATNVYSPDEKPRPIPGLGRAAMTYVFKLPADSQAVLYYLVVLDSNLLFSVRAQVNLSPATPSPTERARILDTLTASGRSLLTRLA
jgi:hypothetical protein